MKKRRLLISIISVLILLLGVSNQAFAQSTFDFDGDGTVNTNDNCPNVAGPASNNGCPLATPEGRPDDIPADSDGDGTADPLDRCPNEAGDGANGGCPEGTDPNAVPPSVVDSITIGVAPPSEDCIVSPAGTLGVNMRIGPHPEADILHVLQVNEWAQVIAAAYQADHPPVLAEHEPAAMMMPFGLLAPFVDPPVPEIDDFAAQNPPIWLLIQTNDGIVAWVLESVIRYGGDCTDLVLPDDVPEIVEMVFLPADDNGVGFPDERPFIFFPVIPDPDPGFEFDILLPTDPTDPSSPFGIVFLAPGCELLNPEVGVYILVCEPDTATMPPIDVPEGCILLNPEAGVYIVLCDFNPNFDTPDELTSGIPATVPYEFTPACLYVEQEAGVFVLECADGSTPTIMYCVIELGNEAGMYVEVCYEIEIPEGCTVDTSEAGVWHFDCDDDGEVDVTPFGNDLPILNAQDNGDAVLIGLLLPAVQAARE